MHGDYVEILEDSSVPVKEDDLAAKYACDLDDVSPAAVRRAKLKSWMILVPLQTLIYFCYYADKITSSNSSVMGFQKDLHMGDSYNWFASSFYLGYLALVGPVSYLLHRYPIAKITGALVVSWGIFVACMGASQKFRDLLAMRVIAGGLISGVTPSMTVITAIFFPIDEQWAVSTVWYCGVGFGQLICDWVAYGCFKPQWDGGSLAIEGWRILFISFGCFTVIVGVLWILIVPDIPTEAWWLTEEEKKATLVRIRDNQQGFGTHKWKWYQVKEAFVDIRTWIYFLASFSIQIGSGGVVNFSVLTIKSLGYNDLQSLAMDSIGGAADIVVEVLFALLSLNFFKRTRSVYGIFSAVVMTMSLGLLAWGNNPGALSGYILWGSYEPLVYTSLLSFVSSDASGSTKKDHNLHDTTDIVCNWRNNRTPNIPSGGSAPLPHRESHYDGVWRCFYHLSHPSTST